MEKNLRGSLPTHFISKRRRRPRDRTTEKFVSQYHRPAKLMIVKFIYTGDTCIVIKRKFYLVNNSKMTIESYSLTF